jgi:hypothetical protein
MTEPETVELVVRSCTVLHRGRGRTGTWTLYDVAAEYVDGAPLEHPGRSFEPIRRGPGEFTLTYRDHKKYGPTMTLKPVAGEEVGDLHERLEILEERVAAMAAIVYEQARVAA